MERKITTNDFHKHKFADIGEASVAVFGDRVLISITDAARLVRKDRKQLIKWLIDNRLTIFHCAEADGKGFMSVISFDDFIGFCTHERNVADNWNADIFFKHLVETGVAKWCQI